jgi:hypothetical protein
MRTQKVTEVSKRFSQVGMAEESAPSTAVDGTVRRKKRTDYESDLDPYGSPRSKRPQWRRSPHAKLNDNMSTGR